MRKGRSHICLLRQRVILFVQTLIQLAHDVLLELDNLTVVGEHTVDLFLNVAHLRIDRRREAVLQVRIDLLIPKALIVLRQFFL